MNLFLFIAGILTILLSVAHSVLGETLIFRHIAELESSCKQKCALKRRHLNALWSTWHLLTLFGLGIGSILLWMSILGFNASDQFAVSTVLTITLAGSAVFWLLGTKGKHPAWIVFMIIAVLVWGS